MRPLEPVKAFSLEDDDHWTVIPSSSALFGSFPPSEALFRQAVQPLRTASAAGRRKILNARAAIRTLAKCADALILSAQKGQQAVIDAGADMIAASDRAYFGEALRRSRIIPIFVENPTSKEIQEGKGIVIAGCPEIPGELIQNVRNGIYRRRLQDGDIAVERYDLSDQDQRRRAIELLAALIPAGEPSGNTVWLWVTGKLDPRKKLSGENALAYIDAFEREIAAASVNRARLKLFSKPSIPLPSGPQRRQALGSAVSHFRDIRMPLSLNIDASELERLAGERDK
jgi:hypothetical protein